MTHLERLAVLAFLLVVLVLLVGAQPITGSLGAVAGVGAAVAVGSRLDRVRRKVDARVGADVAVPRSGVRVEVVVRRALLQVGLLGLLLVGAALTPFVGDRAYALGAALVTALPAVLTAQGLRRRAG